MNQKLRRRHRRMIAVAAVTAPAILVAALVTRPPAVVMNEIPVAAGNIAVGDTVHLANGTFTLDSTPIAVQLSRSGGALGVRLAPQGGSAVTGADVLVYWHEGGGTGNQIPDDAWLLGTLAGPQARAFALPGHAQAGELLFYSLAQQRLYDERWAIPEQPTAP